MRCEICEEGIASEALEYEGISLCSECFEDRREDARQLSIRRHHEEEAWAGMI